MATISDIKTLLKKINLTIDSRQAVAALDRTKLDEVKVENRIENFLLTNAEYIDMRKLVTIIVKDLRLLLEEYKKADVSRLLEETIKQDLEEAIKFAKLYVKPDEKVLFIDSDIDEEFSITSCQEVIYGKKSLKDGKKYDRIAYLIPKEDQESIKRSINVLEQCFNDGYIARIIIFSAINNALIRQGYSLETINEICSTIKTIDEGMNEFLEILDVDEFNESLKWHLDADVIKENIDTDKYILFKIQRINEKLENQEEINEDEIIFLQIIDILIQDFEKNARIKIGQGEKYGIKQVEQFLSKLDVETLEYVTEEQLKSGEKLLQDTKGYEEYLKKEKLIELAEIEGNLLFLAKNNKLNNSTIFSILYKTEVSEDTLVELCVNGNISIEQLEKIRSTKTN